ncbi:MAG: hypothetical protein RSC58_03910 [Ruthenibacterium sp.]
MNRTEFLAALAAKLVDVTDDEREEAIQYYNEYLDEAGSENEESAIAELGTPEKVANIIRANCGFSLKAAPKAPTPELTLDGPQYDAHTQMPPVDGADSTSNANASAHTQAGGDYADSAAKRTNGDNSKLILIVLLVVTFPVWIGALGGLFGIVVGLIATVFALICAGFAVLIAGIVVFVFSIGQLIAAPANGLISMGLALLCIALGALLSAGSLWCIFKGAPVVIRAIVSLVNSLLGKVRNLK